MKRQVRPFAVERRALAPRRAAPKIDDRAELKAVAELLQNVPRESTASFADLLFHNRRMAGRIMAVAERLPAKESTVERVLTSLPARIAGQVTRRARPQIEERQQMELRL